MKQKTFENRKKIQYMEYFKIILETGKKRSRQRNVYVTVPSIADAMTISCKIRDSKLVSIKPITYNEYMLGIDKKYTNIKKPN